MKMFKTTQWPSKRLIFIALLNFIMLLLCLPFFPLVSPCHWSIEGIANGYMNKYLYIIYYLLPFLLYGYSDVNHRIRSYRFFIA